jgi:hypothetical protein
MVNSKELFSYLRPIWTRMYTFQGLSLVPTLVTHPRSNEKFNEAATVLMLLRTRISETMDPIYETMRNTFGSSWPYPCHGDVTHVG